MNSMTRAAIAAAALALVATVGPRAEGGPGRLGPETNLPLPRFVSLKVEKANVRRGPGLNHRIDWVFLRRGMPLEVVAEHGHWRKVRDADDAGGWVHYALLRGARTGVVTAPEAALRADPAADAALVARAEAGVIGRLDRCRAQWCEIEAEGFEGWVLKADIWGATAAETFD